MLSGTRFPCYQEPWCVRSLCNNLLKCCPSNYANSESFGFLLTERAFRGLFALFIIDVRISIIIANRLPQTYGARSAFSPCFHDHQRCHHREVAIACPVPRQVGRIASSRFLRIATRFSLKDETRFPLFVDWSETPFFNRGQASVTLGSMLAQQPACERDVGLPAIAPQILIFAR